MGSKSSGQIAGYKYFIGIHLALCYGPINKVSRILFNDLVAWTGTSTGATIQVDEPELFGGEGKEGGVGGDVSLHLGLNSQPQSPYLISNLGANIPAFRGVCCALFESFYIGNNPYLKPIAIECTRTTILTNGNAMWYSAKADIGGDMNPIHALYEAITNDEWGIGYPDSSIDLTTFTTAADTIYNEGLGFSTLWNKQEPINKFMQVLLDHVYGVILISPVSGKFIIKLFRDDYNPATLAIYNEDNISKLSSYARRAWGETINEVTVVYREKNADTDAPVTIQDTANIQFQGSVINKTIQFPGITNGTAAAKVAQRELKVISSPLAKISIEVNREAWSISIGDVFKLSWDDLTIVSQIFRVMAIDTGSLTKGRIRITALEDVFGAPSTVYAQPQGTLWVVPSTAPVDLARQRIEEATYWDIQMTVRQADINTFTAGFGFLGSMGSSQAGVNYGYELHTKTSVNPYLSQGTWVTCPSALVTETLVPEVTTNINFTSNFTTGIVSTGTYAYINDEIVEVTAFDDVTLTATLKRGVLDTVPVDHTSGAVIYFVEKFSGKDSTEYTETDVVNAKLLERTNLGTFPIGSATELSLTMTNRYARPYAPGNVKICDIAYNNALTGQLQITWSHRDRTQQLAYLVDQDEGDIGPEAGVTYTLRIYNELDVLDTTVSGISGTLYEFTSEADSNTKLLMHFDDSIDGSVNIINNAFPWHSFSVFGDAQLDTAFKQFGDSSLLLDGNGDYLSSPAHTNFDIGTGDFTIEFWVRLTSNPGGLERILAPAVTANQTGCLQIWASNTTSGGSVVGAIELALEDGTGPIVSTAVTIVDSTFHHVAFARSGTTLKSFLDGTEKESVTNSIDFDLLGTEGLFIGNNSLLGAGTYFAGHLDEFRFVKGIAKYTASFTAPTQSFGQDITGGPPNSSLRFELESIRSGLASHQFHNITVSRVGYGYNFGNFWGGT